MPTGISDTKMQEWTSNLSKAHETRDSLAVSLRRLSRSLSIHFDAIYSWNLRCSHKLPKIQKSPILRVHGHSRSSMLTTLKSLLLLLVIISSMAVPICNRDVHEKFPAGIPRETVGNTAVAGMKLAIIVRDGNLIDNNLTVAVGRIASQPENSKKFNYLKKCNFYQCS